MIENNLKNEMSRKLSKQAISQEVIIAPCKKLLSQVVLGVFQDNGLKNKLMVPLIKVIYITTGAGKVLKNDLELKRYIEAFSLIAGQKAVVTKAKKSVSAFMLREGDYNGVKVTLRKNKMYEFLDRLKTVYFARMPDFRGLDRKSFNGKSISIGIKRAHSVFPEVASVMNVYDFMFGLNINIVFNIADKDLQVQVLEKLGIPFKN